MYEFKLGDRVYCDRRKESGVVTSVLDNNTTVHPINVHFSGGHNQLYTRDGQNMNCSEAQLTLEFQIGDRVYCAERREFGVITCIWGNHSRNYPIEVTFTGYEPTTYTRRGQATLTSKICLTKAEQDAPITVEPQPTTKDIPMATKPTIKENAGILLTKNKLNAMAVARVTAGKALNKKAMALIKPKLPMMVRGYMDSGIAPVVLANIVGMAIRQYTDNAKALLVADLMLEASAFQAAESFNIDELLEGLIDGIKLPDLGDETESHD